MRVMGKDSSWQANVRQGLHVYERMKNEGVQFNKQTEPAWTAGFLKPYLTGGFDGRALVGTMAKEPLGSLKLSVGKEKRKGNMRK